MTIYYVDAAKYGSTFIIGYCDEFMQDRSVRTLPFCHKSHLAEIEAVKWLLEAKIETIRIRTDSEATLNYFNSHPLRKNVTLEKIPRDQNVANQILAAFKQNRRIHHDQHHDRP